ncbi:K(+)-INSENSITIVE PYROPHOSPHATE-ENERGIZED PROTON PUMP [Salix koriyanagi]|uniref:H(+)-exporting diphosphatase n=1 Tax=Salix koriyanagi TaxID=2511006 RepID=A0A9Q0PXQ7_9ROSI|nr:K(+)-INSENSITIVE PYROPHOSPHATE-ENERGIZED PROTON PUMP [Salix koriyanagi]
MPHPSLFTEYQSVGVSMVAFAPLIFLFPSSVKGFRMRNRRCLKMATFDNARTALEARKRVGKAFITAFRFGAVMGSLLAANGLLEELLR